MLHYVNVLPACPVSQAYTYVWPFPETPEIGEYVTIPFRGRSLQGVVWEIPVQPPLKATLKAVEERHPYPPMPLSLRDYLMWVASYTVSPLGAVLKLALPIKEAFAPLTARQKTHDFYWPVAEAGAKPILSPEQKTAAETLCASLGHFQPFLIDGVTGSGKTEVYSEVVAACLAARKQAVLLMPEIALSNAMTQRLMVRFGVPPALWHSGLTPAKRRETWRAIVTGEAPIVIGARSALFLPYANLGLVVVDEEHDGSYKQEEGVFYHARDMAVMRGKFAASPVVLVSATPSLETVRNVERGKYTAVHLPERHGTAQLPKVTLVDLAASKLPKGTWIAPLVRHKVRQVLERGEQALLFLNRRGYAPLSLCGDCGHRLQCPHCTAWMVLHRAPVRLECHHCGARLPIPKACPNCQSPDSLVPCGPGVERIAEEALLAFPEARPMVFSSDALDTPAKVTAALRAVEEGEVNLLIGTQVLAKGHHFPNLTLVAVLDADVGLAGGDVRAAEKTWQLLHQVAGRAGRAEKAGEVFLQTFNPKQTVLTTLSQHDRDGFLAAQLAEREVVQFPPFGRLAALILSGKEERILQLAARALAVASPRVSGVEILGPAPAPMARLAGQYRMRFLVKTGLHTDIQKVLTAWLAAVTLPPSIRLQVDIDPYSFW